MQEQITVLVPSEIKVALEELTRSAVVLWIGLLGEQKFLFEKRFRLLARANGLSCQKRLKEVTTDQDVIRPRLMRVVGLTPTS